MGGQMRTYKVTTPAAGYSGEIGGVFFVKGEAVVEAPAPLAPLPYSDDDGQLTRRQLAEREEIGQHPGYRAMAYFRQAGYVVEDITAEDDQAVPDAADVPPPARNASTEEWRAFMTGTDRLSADEASKLGRDQLVDAYERGVSA